MNLPRSSHKIELRSELWDRAPEIATLRMSLPGLVHDPMDRSAPETAWRLLAEAGFSSPEEAWDAWEERPSFPALVIDGESGERCAPDPGDPLPWLRRALVLGKCGGSLFAPEAPVIWTMNRLGRPVRLVSLEPANHN